MQLATLKQETSHHLNLPLDGDIGSVSVILTISGSTSPEGETFLSNWDRSREENMKRKMTSFSLRNTVKHIQSNSLGCLIVKVYRAKGLNAADLGGSGDPFCVLELDNTSLRTHTE